MGVWDFLISCEELKSEKLKRMRKCYNRPMLKKIEKAYVYLEKNLESLSCPLCRASFSLEPYALRCENKHTFNLNKKGYGKQAIPLYIY